MNDLKEGTKLVVIDGKGDYLKNGNIVTFSHYDRGYIYLKEYVENGVAFYKHRFKRHIISSWKKEMEK